MRTKFIVFILAGLLFSACNKPTNTESFTVMAWNILHGGNDIPNGKTRVMDIIREFNPDIILMVETYGSGKEIADSLGYEFHLVAPEGTALDDPGTNLSVFSKFPIVGRIDTEYSFYLGGVELIIAQQKVRVFSNWFHYVPWSDIPEELGMTADELLEWEKSGAKYEMLQKVLPYFSLYAASADSVPLVIGGDMNAPSHLDWGEEMRSIHNNLVVPWYTTKVLENLGLIDSYRAIHPNPITHPGITWDVKGIKDEHRIDYIFYKGSKLKATASEIYKAHLGETFHINGKQIPYPSDHGFVITTFELQNE